MTSLSVELHDLLQPFISRGEVAGVVAAVASFDDTIAEATVGFADIANSLPMTRNTLFWIASQTKPITAAALMMLVDDGKVSLDEPVKTYLPELESMWLRFEETDSTQTLVRPQRPITLRDLLSHTSGMPFRSDVERPVLDRLPLENAVYSYAITPLNSQPGTKYDYSNAGINTAARIIEVITETPYDQFLQEQLILPLGMTDTTFWPNAEQVSRLAKLYEGKEGEVGLVEREISQLTYPLDGLGRFAMPAGGLFSSLDDVVVFCRLLLCGGELSNKRYLSNSSVMEMSRKQTPESSDARYGLGCSIGDGYFGHGGACCTYMNIYPQIHRIAVFLVQHTGFAGQGNAIRDVFDQFAREH